LTSTGDPLHPAEGMMWGFGREEKALADLATRYNSKSHNSFLHIMPMPKCVVFYSILISRLRAIYQY